MADPRWEIIVLRDSTELTRHIVGPGEYLIGRAPKSSIPISVGPVSRVHARLTVSPEGEVQIEDLGSSNGTFLDDVRISDPTAWEAGQMVTIGDTFLRLEPAGWEVSVTLAQTRISDLQSDPEPITPASPQPLTPAPTPSFSSGRTGEEVVRKHLPLKTREAQQYALGSEVARGGMGAVIEAKESATRRTVAMKVMLNAEAGSDAVRFIEEAQVTAQLEHPNIVPVHDLGIDENGLPFYTMKLVSGITLKKVLELVKEGAPGTVAKYPLNTLLTIFQKVCDALAFAHSRGVIHRDLKPANIMLGKFGEVLVMDWGLAKVLGRKAKLGAQPSHTRVDATIVSARRSEEDAFSTLAGSVMGTPHYMSPEQARGEIDQLDGRSDIFALGTILYELLTLERPFSGKRAAEIITRIIDGDFVPPRQRFAPVAGSKPTKLPHLPNGEIPESLDAIVRKAMALDPAERYADVPALQADITAFQNGFATSAEQATAWTHFKLYVARNKRLAATIAGCGLALLVSSGAFTWRVVCERDRAEAGEAAARRQTQIAELNTEAAQLVNAARTEPEDALIRSLLAAEKSRALLGVVSPSVQHGLAAALEGHRLERVIDVGMRGESPLAWSETSRRFAVVTTRELRVVDFDTGNVITSASAPSLDLTEVCLSNDASLVAAGGKGAQIAVWKPGPQNGGSPAIWPANASGTRAIAFLPDTQNLITVAANGAIETWSDAGKALPESWRVDVQGGAVGLAAINPATRRVVMVPEGPVSTEAWIVTPTTPGQTLKPVVLGGHVAKISAIAICENGHAIATGDADGAIRIWSNEGALIGGPFLAHRGTIDALALTPEGDTVASRGADSQCNVYTRHGVLLHGPFESQTLRARALLQTSDARLLLGEPSRVQVINLLGVESDPAIPSENTLEDIIVSQDGKRVLALDGQGILLVWDADTQEELVRKPVVEGRGQYVLQSPDGRALACTARTGSEVRFVGLDGGSVAKPLKLEPNELVQSTIFAPDGRLVVSTTTGAIVFHDLKDGTTKRMTFPIPGGAKLEGVELTAGPESFLARVMATGSPRVRLIWFDWQGRVLSDQPTFDTFLDNFNASHRCATIFDGGSQVMYQVNRDVFVWPAAQRIPREANHLRTRSSIGGTKAVPLPGGHFAYANAYSELRFFTLAGEPVSPWLRRDKYYLDSLSPMPDGRRIATGGGDRRVRFWHSGIDAWMEAAAQRLAHSSRMKNPASDSDRQAAGIVARLSAARLARQPVPIRYRTKKFTQNAMASDSVPPGYTPLPNTPIACLLPTDWQLAEQSSIALVNKMLAGQGMSFASRQGEVEFVHGIHPKGQSLRDLFAGGKDPGFIIIRFDGGGTAADVIRMTENRMGPLRGINASPLFFSWKFDPSLVEAQGITRWNEALDCAYWEFGAWSAAGEKLIGQAYIIPTRKACFIVAAKCVEKDGVVQTSDAVKFIGQLHIAADQKVDDRFRTEMRAAIEGRFQEEVAKVAGKGYMAEIDRLRLETRRLTSAKTFDEAIAMTKQATAISEKAAATDPGEAIKWQLETVRSLQNLVSYLSYAGQWRLAGPAVDEALLKLEALLAQGDVAPARALKAELTLRQAQVLRVNNSLPESAATFDRGLALTHEVLQDQPNAYLAERAIEASCDYVLLRSAQRDPVKAGEALDQVLRLQQWLITQSEASADRLRVLFDDAGMVAERVFSVRGAEATRAHIAERMTLLDSDRAAKSGTSPDQLAVYPRFLVRMLTLADRNPKAELLDRKAFAERLAAWSTRLAPGDKPANAEQTEWRTRAESILRP